MLTVIFYEDSLNRLSSFVADGHAGFAGFGDDIVCAAVSAILQAARLGLQAVAQVDLDVVVQQSGRMEIRWPEDRRGDEAVSAIVRTAQLSIDQIAQQFPQHVTCRVTRVD